MYKNREPYRHIPQNIRALELFLSLNVDYVSRTSQKRRGQVMWLVFLKFWASLHVFGIGEAMHFKFWTQINYVAILPAADKTILQWGGSSVTSLIKVCHSLFIFRAGKDRHFTMIRVLVFCHVWRWLWGHRACRWCGSSYSIRTPSLKFVGLPIPDMWLIFGHSVKWPGDLDLWPFDHGTGADC